MEFWLGLLASIPLAIFANLATPKVRRWLDRYGKKQALVRSKNFLLEYQTIRKYHTIPQEFTQYLLFVVIQTAFVGAITILLSGILGLVSIVFASKSLSFYGYLLEGYDLINILYLTIQYGSIIGTLLIIDINRRALATWYKVKDFDAYEKSLQPYLNAPD